MKVALGIFACSGIETFLGGDLASGTQAALRHYTTLLRAGFEPIGLPAFCLGAWAGPSKAIDVPLDSDIEQSLQREVQRLGASLEQLIAHAVLIYLADLDRSLDRGRGREPDGPHVLQCP
jgi:hypothetical protein